MHILIEIQPLNMSSGAREAVRVASAQDRRITGLNGVVWVPAIVQTPVLTIRLFDGDFGSSVQPGTATFSMNLAEVEKTYPNAYAYLWSGAPVSIYAEEPGTAWPWTRRFVGKVSRFEKESSRLQLVAEVDTAALGKDVLSLTYAGTTGIEGGADLKDRPRPWVLGHVKGIEPVQIDVDNSVFQVSGYGPIGSISALYERGSSFGDPMADYADYAALVAATIPPGRWATCLAQGLFRLGAPPFGVITADVEGHKVGSVVPRRTGAIIRTVAAAIGIASDSIDAASMDALDAAVPRNVGIYLTEQETFIDLAQRMCLPCNAYSGMSWQGKFFAVRPVFGSAALTLHGQGRADPQVLRMVEGGVNPPFKKTIFGADKCWRVHSTTDIAYQDILVDRGRYQAGETYRAGNIVDLADGSRWLYIADTATSGNAPQAGSAFWELISDQVQPVYLDGTPMEDLKPAEPGATEGAVIPTPGSSAPGNIKDENGVVRDPAEILNSSLEATQGGRIGYEKQSGRVEVLRLTPRLLETAPASAIKQVENDLDNLQRAVTLALSETTKTNITLRDAGVYTDPANGRVRISAIDQTAERLNLAEITIDAQRAAINLKASVNYVDEQIILAVLNPEQAAELGPLLVRLTQAETDIDGLNASIITKASVVDLNVLGGRVTTAESDIDALQGQITLKVDNTTFDALADRVTTAETQLEAVPDAASIRNSVTATRLVQRQVDDLTGANILGLLLGDRAKRDEVAAIAAARNELGARITEEGEAQARFALTLQSRIGAAESSIATESITRAGQFGALAQDITSLQASLEDEVGTLQANIDDLAQVVVDETGALATSIGEVSAALTQEVTDREGAVETVDARVTTVEEASVERDGEIRSLVTRQATAIRGSQTSLDDLIDRVVSGLALADRAARQASEQLAFAREEITATITDLDSGTASRLFALGLRIGAAEGSIRELDRVVIENNTALVQSIDTLTLSTTASISTLTTDLSVTTGRVETVEGDVSNTIGRVDGLEEDLPAGLAAEAAARTVEISGAITSERVLWQEGDSILAGDITSLSTTVGENTATLITFGESIDGLEARWGVKVDVDGRVGGFVVNGTAEEVDATFVVDTFSLVDPDTGFEYLTADEDGLRLQNGKIVMDNGTYMKVTGTGFGTSSQFIEWFGPTRAINLCDEASALSYLKTNGDAYFGGSLSAGVIRNAVRTTAITDDASVTVGPFGTNGDPILVVTSYSLISGQTIAYPATTGGLEDWEEAVTLWGATATGTNPNRAVNATKAISCSIVVETDGPLGASSSPFSTLTISGGTETLVGTAPIVGDTDGVLVYTRTISGSVTSTDNSGGTANRTFIATLTTRTGAVLGTIQSQIISLTATEE